MMSFENEYSGGTILGHLGQSEAPRIEAPSTYEEPKLHLGIEWRKNYSGDSCYEIFHAVVDIEHNPASGEYAFFHAQGDGYDFLEHCTPETIDEIIAKLEHFKRVVFGDGE